ncbi:MAG TPA: phospholipase D-like domain-containing protein [Acetobacteraceae bacterium]|jgi:cardiolipin synthase|nr:phospholipase D-like domain-containing protein [Acetobacteraceae bacterium]
MAGIRDWGVARAAVPFLAAGLGTLLALNALPARRQLRYLLPHRRAVSDPGFLREMEGSLAPAIREGCRVETLVNGDRIFPAMLDAIRGARRSINLETYVYWTGMPARLFANALAERARAGVEVRVLLDWQGSIPMNPILIRFMRRAGCDVRRFRRPAWWRLDRMNNRTHRKLMIVDGRTGFTGGVGIAEEWQGDARNAGEWRDNHYQVTGPVVADMQAAFIDNWLEASGELPRGEAHFPELERAGDMRVQLAASSPQGGTTTIHLTYMMAIAAAERHIRIAVPYFVPDELAIDHLVAAARRGVRVDILVPGRLIDQRNVRRASRGIWGRLLEAGVRIHEYEPTMLHSKLMVVDEAFAAVGSANFDERSFRLNDEANLNVFHEGFAREQIAVFEADLARARAVTLQGWRRRPLAQRTGELLASALRAQL